MGAIITLIILYVVFIVEFETEVKYKGKLHHIDYVGLLWILIDFYSMENYYGTGVIRDYITYNVTDIEDLND